MSQPEGHPMLRRSFCAGIALLLTVGLTLAEEKKKEEKGKGNVVFGKVVSLDLKDGVGTLTVMARKARGEEPKEMKFLVTKDTKFVKGGGPGQEGTPVDAAQLSDTFKKDQVVAIRPEGEGEKMTAKTVSAVTPRPKK